MFQRGAVVPGRIIVDRVGVQGESLAGKIWPRCEEDSCAALAGRERLDSSARHQERGVDLRPVRPVNLVTRVHDPTSESGDPVARFGVGLEPSWHERAVHLNAEQPFGYVEAKVLSLPDL